MANQDEQGKKDKVSFWSNVPEIIKAISLVIGAIGGLGALILALNEVGLLDSLKPTPTLTNAPPAISAPSLDLQPMGVLEPPTLTVAPGFSISSATTVVADPPATGTPIPKYAWAVNFEYGLKAYYWKSGTRSYRIMADCPGADNDVDKRIEFTVSEEAQLFAGDAVELRFNGIASPIQGDSKLPSIHPQQETKIVLGYINLSQEQASQFVSECQVQAILNDNFNIQLSPIGPFVEN